LPQAFFDPFQHIAPHAAQLHRFGSAEQQDAIHPRQQLAAAALLLLQSFSLVM